MFAEVNSCLMSLKNHAKIALIYFLIAAVLGGVLRAFYAIEIPINYRFVVHGHSHIALLGWVYLALTTLICEIYIEPTTINKKYRLLFWLTQLSLVGMLVTFPFTGYAVLSIVFSTTFLIVSYGFTAFVCKHVKEKLRFSQSFKCVKMALGYMVLSSIGPWCLGAIMATVGKASIWYRMAIYFYLHFQYNGWMILALVGLFIYVLEYIDISISNLSFKRFFWCLNMGIIGTFFLSTLWIEPGLFFNVLGGIGGGFQIVAIGLLGGVVWKKREIVRLYFTKIQYVFLQLVALLLAVKLVLQLIVAVPYFAKLTNLHIDFVIGYLHGVFLGVVSVSVFVFFDFFKLLKLTQMGSALYIIGFVGTEALIFYKGFAAWQGFGIFDDYFKVLAFCSFLIPISLVLFARNNFNASSKQADNP